MVDNKVISKVGSEADSKLEVDCKRDIIIIIARMIAK